MYVSLADSRAKGFMKWSDAHQLKLGGARAGAGEGGVIAAPDLDQGVTAPPNSRIVRGSCLGQVRSTRRGWPGFRLEDTFDDLLSDAVMASVLRRAGYEPDEFREMMTEMVWNPVSLTESPRDIVVIGASRGGIEAIRGIVAALPPNLQSTLLIVLHTRPTHASLLPDILSRAGPLPAEHGRNGMRIARGRIYVAPPDHHMTVGPIGMLAIQVCR